MNFHRGFRRLFLVLGILYYLIGGLYLYNIRVNGESYHQFVLSECLEGARTPGSPLTEDGCRKAWPPPDHSGETVGILGFPALLYGGWRILAWIGRGFKVEGHTIPQR
jgi:hypothetical protein